MNRNRFIPLISNIPKAVPTASGMYDGELAVNIADGKLYTKSGSFIIALNEFNTDGYVSSSQQVVSLINGQDITPSSVTSSFSGPLIGTASFATTALTVLQSSFTGSFTGSFAGTHSGDGSNLIGVPTTLNIIGVNGTGQVKLLQDNLIFTGSGGITADASGSTITIRAVGLVSASDGQVDFNDILNKPTLVSSSAQINLAEATGTATSSLTASLALNVSGSSGRVLYNSANNTTATSENLEFDGTNLTVGGQLNAATKSFVIKHQRMPDKKLVYGVSEGPEHSVFIRGKLSGTNQIILPEEWDWLVDLDSLSVQLTPIGKYQKLYVDSIDGLVITVGNDNLMSKNINCFYLIHATRKDVAPLQTVI
jgi:hypothetical protein